jgi:hypothetical protein
MVFYEKAIKKEVGSLEISIYIINIILQQELHIVMGRFGIPELLL